MNQRTKREAETLDQQRRREVADVVQLAAFRARRATPAPKPIAPAHLQAQPGRVLLQLSDKSELDLSPAHARIWAERLAAMADVAEALEREGHQ